MDLCILLGCDYCDSIRGIGPVRALELMKKYGNIETILKHLDKTKYPVPESFNYEQVRQLFLKPQVTDPTSFDVKLCQFENFFKIFLYFKTNSNFS